MSEIGITDDSAPVDFLGYAERIARMISNVEGRSQVLTLIAKQSAQSGEIDRAIDLAEGIDDPYTRDQTLADIAALSVGFGEADYADELLGMIEDPGLHGLAVEQMACKYAEIGEFDQAIETAHGLDDSAPALSRIAFICAEGGFFERAVEVARAIEYADLRAATLGKLAAWGLRDGRHVAAAAELLTEAARAAGETELPQDRINALIELASLYKDFGREERGLELLDTAYQLCEKFEGPTYVGLAKTVAKDEVLVQIAAGFAALKRYDRADQVFEEIEDSFQFASALIKVALENYGSGRGEQARALLAEAREAGLEGQVVGRYGVMERDRLLAELSIGYVTTGDSAAALQLAETLSSPPLRHDTLREIAKLCVRSGNHGLAFQVAEMIGDACARVLCWLDLGDAFVASGQPELADRASSKALAESETIGHAFSKAMALMDTASRFARGDRAGAASGLLYRALTAASAIEDSYYAARALVELDGKYRELGREAGDRERQVLEGMMLEL